MSLFEGPEYASYIQLCRELRLERKFEAGDWYWSGPPREYVSCCHGFNLDGEWQQGLVWIPRLDQWLTILVEAGVPMVVFQSRPDGTAHVAYRLTVDAVPLLTLPYTVSSGPVAVRDSGSGGSREEAMARLWMAVTGRTVTSG